MARLNLVTIIGKVESDTIESREIEGKYAGGKDTLVSNFLVKCFDEKDQRFYKLPITVWGEKESDECVKYLKKGDLVYVQGELRYKFIRNKESKNIERIYTTVKATTIEFISKKLKDKKLEYYLNEVRLIGNLVNEPVRTEDGFVVAVDRLYPTKEVHEPNPKLTDFVTLVIKSEQEMPLGLKKGSTVIVDGNLVTRKKREDKVVPRVVVNVREIVGR